MEQTLRFSLSLANDVCTLQRFKPSLAKSWTLHDKLIMSNYRSQSLFDLLLQWLPKCECQLLSNKQNNLHVRRQAVLHDYSKLACCWEQRGDDRLVCWFPKILNLEAHGKLQNPMPTASVAQTQRRGSLGKS